MHDDGYFGEAVAARYDDSSADMFSPEVVDPTVEFLAGEGRALEFAIGTGRVAIPLHQRGVPVHGIELSTAMLAQLRQKPGSHGIETTIGDMSTIRVEGTFDLGYLVLNTILNLTTQDDQVACVQNAADHLRPGGFFVIEVIVPGWERLLPGERFKIFDVSDDHWGVDEVDVVTQAAVSHHIWDRDGELTRLSMPFRYVWPSELDLMAKLAGMTLRERWGDWDRSAFTATSPKHVSVWEKTADSA
jgi:SAM-dependent methyltransferase